MNMYRRWLSRMVVVAGMSIGGPLLAATPTLSTADALVRAMTSDRHAERDAAFVALVELGPEAIDALVSSSTSADPELAWRSNEALQVICRTVDTDVAAKIHAQLIALSQQKQPQLAAAAKQSLKHWVGFRNEFARDQLERLGARIGDGQQGEYASMDFDGGVMFGGGGFVVEDGGDVIIDEKGIDVVEVAEDLEAVAEAIEAVPEKIGGIPLFGGIFKALGRVAGDAKAAEDARGEAIAEVIEKKMEAALGRLDELAEGEAIEEEAEAIEVADEVIAMDAVDVDFAADPFDGDVMWLGPDGSGQQMVPAGTMLLDSNWRGGDVGLRYASDLQHVYRVVLRDAPITDSALANLKTIKSLNQLEVTGTQITGEALRKLHRDRPQLNILALGPAVIGITGQNHPQGLIVQQVMSETGARRAGIDTDDIITHVNGAKIQGFDELTLSLFDTKPGEKVKIDYIRGGKKQQAVVVLTARDTATASLRGQQPALPQIHMHRLEAFDAIEFER